MFVITARNVHEALPMGLNLLEDHGVRSDSRNGPVVVVPGPVTTHYLKPRERVLFWPERDANPFFHLMESLWMLAGRNDLAFVKHYVKRFESFSDDGKILHGAYGYRWREHFDVEGGGHPSLPDQLETIVKRLREDPTDRRCVLTMWDPVADLDRKGKDVPCNLNVLFWLRRDPQVSELTVLDMTVFCRSNDVIWGAYGANAVHFSMLQEYMAAAIGCGVGEMWQISNNYHAYVNVFEPLYDSMMAGNRYLYNPYVNIQPYPLAFNCSMGSWDEDNQYFIDHALEEGQFVHRFKHAFFRNVAEPMRTAHHAVQAKLFDNAAAILNDRCVAEDWKLAGLEWIKRRQAKYLKASDDGPSHK